METDTNNSYGRRGLPLPPSVHHTPPEEHIYATPTLYGLQNRTETTSFAPDADVRPRFGTLNTKKNYRTGGFVQSNPKAIPVEVPQPGKKKDEFYDKVYDDGACANIEEIYDPIKLDLGPALKKVPANEWSSSEEGEDSFSSGTESGSTGWLKIGDDNVQELDPPPEGEGAAATSVKDVAENPLYDTPRPQTDFNH